MSSDQSDLPVLEQAKSDGALSRPRPQTLLAMCGIALAAILLIVTGLVADYLRDRTLAASETAISQLDAVLTAAADRSLQAVDAILDGVCVHLHIADAASPDTARRLMAAPEAADFLKQRTELTQQLGGIALVDTTGAVIASAGAWPRIDQDVATRDYFAALQADPKLNSFVGKPIPADGEPGAADHAPGFVVPLARKLRDAAGGFAGLAVGVIPVRDFDGFYRAVQLGDDGMIALVRRDGTLLAEYPTMDDAAVGRLIDGRVATLLHDGGQGIVEGTRDADGQWRISALGVLPDYPIAVLVSRDGDKALIGWARQAVMFGAFAICGVIAIGLMVVSIGRQIHTHSMLATMRAEKAEMEHARLVAEAELLKNERLSVLGQFTATVANELRNPLSAIRNTLFTMREIATSSGLVLDRPIARIQRSISRCDRIIGDILEYIRSPELSRASVSFDHWLRELLSEHSVPPAVKLFEECSAHDAVVRIDTDRIRRVIINLIDNAAQALSEMPPGSGMLRITVRSAIVDGMLEFAVADNGPGIPSENLARIFEPLFSTKSFGAGLGLATVKQIVVQHAGTITVDSRPGSGTSVVIRLPLEQTLRIAA